MGKAIMAHDEHEKQPIIIIKKIKKVHAAHHGGSWKIAYADFVTAMMTFFLLMWLLSMLNKYQLQGISQYFKKPLKEVFNKQAEMKNATTIEPNKNGPTIHESTGSSEKTDNFNDQQFDKISKDDAENLKQLKDLKKVQEDLINKMNKDKEISQFKNQLNFIITSDGLKIVIKDLENNPMFSQGKTDFQQYANKILNWLSAQINQYNNKIIIIGHTDSLQYSTDSNYTNWELSADRANATRRVLEKSGIERSKILRVIGGADTDLLDKQKSDNPANRRIEIIMVTDKVAKQIQEE